MQPIAWNHRYRHRVDDGCVEIDASTWEVLRRVRTGYDWSGQPSGLRPRDVRAPAVQRARDFLISAGDERSVELAAARDVDLLRPPGRALLEELYDVDAAMTAANPVRHVPLGLVERQVRLLPPRAVREAVVNGVAHRDWVTVEPTLVEQTGSRLVVTSPGGFVGGVTPSNIINHPSRPRNRALAELLAALHVAEREGIGVDRMVGDMIRLGHRHPAISEIPGPHVRTALTGSELDLAWMAFLDALDPPEAGADLDVLLLLRQLFDTWWIDEPRAAPILQRTEAEAHDVIASLLGVRVLGRPVVRSVAGVPATATPAWCLTPEARAALTSLDDRHGRRRSEPSRAGIAHAWAVARGRVSSTELAAIVGASVQAVQSVLERLHQDGLLPPGRESRRGAGFFYVPVPSDEAPSALAAREVHDFYGGGRAPLSAVTRELYPEADRGQGTGP